MTATAKRWRVPKRMMSGPRPHQFCDVFPLDQPRADNDPTPWALWYEDGGLVHEGCSLDCSYGWRGGKISCVAASED